MEPKNRITSEVIIDDIHYPKEIDTKIAMLGDERVVGVYVGSMIIYEEKPKQSWQFSIVSDPHKWDLEEK